MSLGRLQTYKHLGVHFRTNISWEAHINRICARAGRSLSFLARDLHMANWETKLEAYTTLIQPRLEYATIHGIPLVLFGTEIWIGAKQSIMLHSQKPHAHKHHRNKGETWTTTSRRQKNNFKIYIITHVILLQPIEERTVLPGCSTHFHAYWQFAGTSFGQPTNKPFLKFEPSYLHTNGTLFLITLLSSRILWLQSFSCPLLKRITTVTPAFCFRLWLCFKVIISHLPPYGKSCERFKGIIN